MLRREALGHCCFGGSGKVKPKKAQMWLERRELALPEQASLWNLGGRRDKGAWLWMGWGRGFWPPERGAPVGEGPSRNILEQTIEGAAPRPQIRPAGL